MTIVDIVNKSNVAKSTSTQSESTSISTRTQKEHLQYGQYLKADYIEDRAIMMWRKNHRGLTISDFNYLGKNHAQNMLRNHKANHILFTKDRKCPQQYYPKCLESEILSKSTRTDGMGVSYIHGSSVGTFEASTSTFGPAGSAGASPLPASSVEDILVNLPHYPAYIHNIRIKTSIEYEYLITDAEQLEIESYPCIRKYPLGHADVTIHIEKNGTVMIYIACSNCPLRIKTDRDIWYLFGVLGQVRDRLIALLHDEREIVVPPLLGWLFVGCDLSKDVPITSSLQITGQGVHRRLSEVGRCFSMYVKAMDRETIFRLEENVSFPPEKQVRVAAGIEDIHNRSNDPNWLAPVQVHLGGGRTN